MPLPLGRRAVPGRRAGGRAAKYLFSKLASRELGASGSDFLGSCLYVGGFHLWKSGLSRKHKHAGS